MLHQSQKFQGPEVSFCLILVIVTSYCFYKTITENKVTQIDFPLFLLLCQQRN